MAGFADLRIKARGRLNVGKLLRCLSEKKTIFYTEGHPLCYVTCAHFFCSALMGMRCFATEFLSFNTIFSRVICIFWVKMGHDGHGGLPVCLESDLLFAGICSCTRFHIVICVRSDNYKVEQTHSHAFRSVLRFAQGASLHPAPKEHCSRTLLMPTTLPCTLLQVRILTQPMLVLNTCILQQIYTG